MGKRVVITGLGVVSPIGVGIEKFQESLMQGASGLQFNEELKLLGFGCQIAGVPRISDPVKSAFIKKYGLMKLKSSSILYGCMAGLEAWHDANLETIDRKSTTPDWDSGCIFGTGIGSIEAIEITMRLVDSLKSRKLGGRIAQQTMASGISAYLGGILGCGNQVTTNSSACSTGSEGIIMGYEKIKNGNAKRFLVGSCEGNSPYIWAPFDSMFALNRDNNDTPEKASSPMSINASGFVPASGSGAMVLEELDSALSRGVRIYGEIIGGNVNSGGQRGGASMTIGNEIAIIKCIESAISKSNIQASDIDLISGHLTSTIGDVREVKSWVKALELKKSDFPYINSLKSMIGHGLSASGSIEMVAATLQLKNGFIHPSLNCETLHPEIEKVLDKKSIPLETKFNQNIDIVCKTSLGFGDVNSCIILKKWNS